jgi:hypothetical protein
MAEPKVSILKSVVVELNRVIKIVAVRLQDVEAKKEALRALGLDPAGATQMATLPAGSLASIQAFTEKADDDVDIEAFASVLLDVISVVQAIESFVHVVTDSEDPDLVNDFLDMLLALYLMEAVRLRSGTGEAKAFFQVVKGLGLYQELAAPAGGVFGFTKSILGFLERAVRSVNAENAAEAATLTDVLFLTLAVLSFKFDAVRNGVKVTYGFEPVPEDSDTKADAISRRTLTAQLSLKTEDLEGNEVTASLLLSLAVRPQNQQGFAIELLVGGGGKLERRFGDWKFSYEMEGVQDVDVRTKIKIVRETVPALRVLGSSEGSNLTIGAPSFEVNVSLADQDVDVKLNTKDGGFVLKKDKDTDGFINSLLPEQGVFGAFDLGVGYSLKKRLYVDGGSGLTVLVPLHAEAGPLKLNSFFLKVTGNTSGDGVLAETSLGLSTSFLGFAASVERIGLRHDLSSPADGTKNLGFANYRIGFKPPNGIGLSLDTEWFKGGGFLYLDADKGEYFGALELVVTEPFPFGLKAVGIVNTKMPDGSPGFSMLVIITAEFTAIQLGFGFTLEGVGGLIGLHRTTRLEVLREGIRTNALKSILFPEDVVANMSRIISDLRQVFPPLDGHTLFALMAKIGWGTPAIFTLELGVLFEIPVPRITILGVLKAVLPDARKALLRLQVNFLGVIDYDRGFISFDASLYDSRLLAFVLTGDMAFRLSWGAERMFLVSAGGFHPAFREAPGDLQNMTRITISLLSGENPRITAQSYFAVTSNTVQFGAKVELYAAAAGFNVYGFLGFDVLFQFDPFAFIASIAAGLALRRGSNVIMGIRLSGQLSGPRPWDARGEATFSILFFDVTISFHETWGDEPDAVEAATEDLTQRLAAELDNDGNWTAEPPRASSLFVTVKQVDLSDAVVVHPFGILTFSQRLLPLEVTLDKFGEKEPRDANRFTIAPSDATVRSEPVDELFAPANFFDLEDTDKLARRSFEPMRGGFRIAGAGALQAPAMVSKSVDYELTYVRKKRGVRLFAGLYHYAKDLFRVNLRGTAVAKSPLSFVRTRPSVNGPDEVVLPPEGFAIVSTVDMSLHATARVSGSYTAAAQQLDGLLTANPELAGTLQVVSTYELAAS